MRWQLLLGERRAEDKYDLVNGTFVHLLGTARYHDLTRLIDAPRKLIGKMLTQGRLV